METQITKDFIIDGNIKMARFMGYDYIPFNNNDGLKPGWWKSDTTKENQYYESVYKKIGKDRFLCRNHNQLRFWNNYEWIMEAVVMIEDLGYTTAIKTNYVRINPINGQYYHKISYVKWNSQEWISLEPYTEHHHDPDVIPKRIGKHKITKIQAIWIVVLDFLEWYQNSQNKLNLRTY